MQRVYYLWVNCFAPVLSVAAVVSILCPRNYFFMKMLQEQAEAIALASFGSVLFLLCAEVAYHQSQSNTEGESIGAKMLAALNEHGPQPHWAVPPFACCFIKYMPSHDLTPWHMLLARNFIRQYAFVVVAVSLLAMWCSLSVNPKEAIWIVNQLKRLQKLSALVCIYGLFMLYKSTHSLLEKWYPTAKFVSLKLIVVIMVYQEWLVQVCVKHTPAASDECLADSSIGGQLGEEIHMKTREHFDNMYLVALESILVAYLVRQAFPASELKAKSGEVHGLLVSLDLERMDTAQKNTFDSDSEVSDEDSHSEIPQSVGE